MLPDTGIDDVKKQRNAEYAKHINDLVLSSLKMEGIRLLWGGGGRYEAVRIGLKIVGLLKTEDGGNTLFRNMDNDLPD
jgi:hypothetical protein